MKKQISGSCKLTPQIFQRWANFHLWRGRNPRLKKSIIGFSAFAIAVLLAGLGLQFQQNVLIIAGVAVLLCMFVFGYSVKTAIKRNITSASDLIKDPYHFCLAPTGLVVEIEHEDGNERHDLLYDEIAAVYDANGCFYTYRSKDSCLLIPIGCLNATPEECREFIQSKVGDKYIKVKQ